MKLFIAVGAGLLGTAAAVHSTAAECELWATNRWDGTWVGTTSHGSYWPGCNFLNNKNVVFNTHSGDTSTSGDRNAYGFDVNAAAFGTLCDRDSCINYANQNPIRRWDGDRSVAGWNYGCVWSPGYADVNWNSNSGGVDGSGGQVPICTPTETVRTVQIGYECDTSFYRGCPSGSFCSSNICHQNCNSNSDPRDGFYYCLWNSGDIPDGNHCSQSSHCASNMCVGSTCIATDAPTDNPTASPTVDPTASPTVDPTSGPTGAPTSSPTDGPTGAPTASHVATATTLSSYGAGSFLGAHGDDLYHCSDAHEGCLVNTLAARSKWTPVDEIPYQADDAMVPIDGFTATTSDGEWSTETGVIVFSSAAGQYSQRFPTTCDCQK